MSSYFIKDSVIDELNIEYFDGCIIDLENTKVKKMVSGKNDGYIGVILYVRGNSEINISNIIKNNDNSDGCHDLDLRIVDEDTVKLTYFDEEEEN